LNEKTVIIFCIGRELLEGLVLDRNAHFMASHVTKSGLRVRTIQVLDDIGEELVAAFRHAMALEPAYILVTGGMGPGLNDITRECAAKAADLPLVLDGTARQFLANSYRRLFAKGVVENADLTEDRLKMATIPSGAVCFENLSGTAPAVSFAVGKTTFFLLPGQPEELRRLFSQYVQPRLEKDGPGGYREAVHVDYPGGDESLISRMLGDLGRRHPKVHTRARLQGTEDDLTIRITLSVEGTDRHELQEQLGAAAADLRARLGLEIGRGVPGTGEPAHETFSE
jgi:molybdenum cofactor synthesis domain-containing protein